MAAFEDDAFQAVWALLPHALEPVSRAAAGRALRLLPVIWVCPLCQIFPAYARRALPGCQFRANVILYHVLPPSSTAAHRSGGLGYSQYQYKLVIHCPCGTPP